MTDLSTVYIELRAISESLKSIADSLKTIAKAKAPTRRKPRSAADRPNSEGIHKGREQAPLSSDHTLLSEKLEPVPNPHQETIDDLCSVFRSLRGFKYVFAPRDAKAVQKLLKIATPNEIRERWRIALGHNTFPRCHSILQLQENWNAYAPPKATTNDFSGWTDVSERKKGQP